VGLAKQGGKTMKFTYDQDKFVWGKSDIIDERFLTGVNTICIKDHSPRTYVCRRDNDTNASFAERARHQLRITARSLWCDVSDLFVGLPVSSER
jgi:hypothetical protein